MAKNKKYTKTKYDFYVYTGDQDDSVQKEIRITGETEPMLCKWIINNIEPGSVCYDIGANVFFISELLARVAGKNGKVYSFEPQKNLVLEYKKIQKLNHYKNLANIETYDFGLSNFNGTSDFYVIENNIGGSTISKKHLENYIKNVENASFYKDFVKIKKMNDINLPPDIPDFLKIDIEGSEKYMWECAPDFIKKSKNIAIEITSNTDKDFVKEICEGREIYHYEKPIGKSYEDIFSFLKNKKENYKYDNFILKLPH